MKFTSYTRSTFFAALAFLLIAVALPGHARDVRVAFYGDSTAAGLTVRADGTAYLTRTSEPEVLETLLQARYGLQVYVENHGRPGATCADFLWGQRGVANTWDTELTANAADVIIVNFGLNDAGLMSMEDFKFCMEQLSGKARALGRKFVVNTPNPVDRHYNETYWSIVHIDKSLGVPVVDHWTEIMAIANWQAMLPDGIHPNEALYVNKAERTFEVVSPIVKALGGF